MKIIESAILRAVTENNQDELLTKALIAWFNELANGNELISEIETVEKRINLLLNKTAINLSEMEDDDFESA